MSEDRPHRAARPSPGLGPRAPAALARPLPSALPPSLPSAFACVLALLLAFAPPARAQPGTLVGLELVRTYTPAEIDAEVGGRFRNDGERAPAARYAVDAYAMRFESGWPEGSSPVALAQLFVPRIDAASRPLLAFAPGSTGLVEACAPSRGFVDAGALETYGVYSLAYAGQGWVVTMPNYLGFFDVGAIQPYMIRDAEGRVVLDALRAAAAAVASLEGAPEPTPAFVAGYSQGGHAAFAAADLHAGYAPEVPLAGVLGFGATTDVEAVLREFAHVAPWVLYAYDHFYPDRFEPAALLAEPWASSLVADAERLCIGGAQSYWPGAPGALFAPPFASALADGTVGEAFPEVAELLEANDAGLTGHGLPAILLQGVDDPVVLLETQNAFVAELCARGSAVRYPNYLRTRHETRYIGFRDAMAWMEGVAAGEEPPSDCDLIATP